MLVLKAERHVHRNARREARMNIFIGKGPMDCTRQELAKMAFHETGIFDEEKFSAYWVRYQELLIQKLGYESEYLADILKKQSEEKYTEAREKRRNNLIFAVLFLLSFFFGTFFGQLFGL